MTDCGTGIPWKEAETWADLVAKITVKAIVRDKSQSEAKARSEPWMTKNFGRVFERKKTARADTTARRPMSAWTAIDTFPVIVISGQRDMSNKRHERCSRLSHRLCLRRGPYPLGRQFADGRLDHLRRRKRG
jgi:hypothetical protein